MAVGRTRISETQKTKVFGEGAYTEVPKVIYLDRTYIIDTQNPMPPLLRTNSIAQNLKTGNSFEAGTLIKETDFEDVSEDKSEFKGWVGERKILNVETVFRPNDGSELDGLKVHTIYV